MLSRTKLLFLVVLAGFSLSACDHRSSGVDDPKRRLTDYISKSFSVQGIQDRDALVDYLSGETKARLLAWSEEQFKEAFIGTKKKFIKLVFVEVKAISPQEVNITYELTFLDHGKGHDAKVTNKKFCVMVNEGDKWTIRDVRNLKELVEYQNEMSLP